MSWKRLLLLAALASLTITAALAILILLFGDFGATEARILGTTLAISGYSLLSLPGAILLERRTATLLAWATIALAVAAFCLVLGLIWGGDGFEAVPKLAGTLTAFAAAATQISALTTRRRDGDSVSLVRIYAAAVALAVLLATLVTVAIWAEIEDSETFFRALGALAVFNVFLVALQPLLRRLAGPAAHALRVTLEGSPDQIDEALRRIEGSGVRVRR